MVEPTSVSYVRPPARFPRAARFILSRSLGSAQIATFAAAVAAPSSVPGKANKQVFDQGRRPRATTRNAGGMLSKLSRARRIHDLDEW